MGIYIIICLIAMGAFVVGTALHVFELMAQEARLEKSQYYPHLRQRTRKAKRRRWW